MSPVRFPNSITIAVIGTGLIGPRHADAIQNETEAELFCVVDPNPAAKQIASRYNVAWFDSISEMLRLKGKPDGALVCTPNSSHVAVSKELLSAEIHVLCEKPLATDVEDGKDLVWLFLIVRIQRNTA
jgi:predicted dehydrogenase